MDNVVKVVHILRVVKLFGSSGTTVFSDFKTARTAFLEEIYHAGWLTIVSLRTEVVE